MVISLPARRDQLNESPSDGQNHSFWAGEQSELQICVCVYERLASQQPLWVFSHVAAQRWYEGLWWQIYARHRVNSLIQFYWFPLENIMQTVFHRYNTFRSTVHTYKEGVNRRGSATTGCVTVLKSEMETKPWTCGGAVVRSINLGNENSEHYILFTNDSSVVTRVE